jgi:hypothetical protein
MASWRFFLLEVSSVDHQIEHLAEISESVIIKNNPLQLGRM